MKVASLHLLAEATLLQVMDKQRKFIYEQRQSVLESEGLHETVRGMFEHVVEPIVEQHAGNKDEPVDFDEIESFLQHKVGDQVDLSGLREVPRAELFEWIFGRIDAALERRREEVGEEEWARLEQFLLLDTMDHKWKDHLYAMEVLKAGIGLRGYAQIDPKNEYKKEGFEKFQQLKHEIADQVTNLILRVDIDAQRVQTAPRRAVPTPRQLPPDPVTAQAMVEAMVAAGQAPPEVAEALAKGAKVQLRPRGGAQAAPAQPQQARPQQPAQPATPTPQSSPTGKKPGRNDPCPCGSGIKYKKCCAPAFG